MPSFPGSVFAPTVKAAGNTIQAAHVNDLQDEVVAIEGGYRNATAPLNSSGSTLATLSVVGGSSLASLHVSSNSTFGAAITIGTLPHAFPTSGGSTGDVLTIVSTSGSTMGLEWRPSGATPCVKVTHDAAQAVESTAWIGLNWNTERYDISGMHSTATNSSRITFAESTGIYHVGAQVTFSTWGADNAKNLIIVVNDSSRVASVGPANNLSNVATEPWALQVSADLRVASTSDYVTVLVKTMASTGTVLAESTGAPLGFWARRVNK